MTTILLAAMSTLIATWAVVKESAGPNIRRPAERRTAWIVSLAALLIIGSGVMVRFLGVDHVLWGSDEFVTLLAGIRLHLLPLWNLQAQIRENFFKSLFMSIHGLGDPVFFYLVVAVYRLFDIPITEANLFRAGALLGVASLVLLSLFMRRFFSRGAALTALAFGAWSPALIGVAKTGFQINFIIFLQLAALLAYLLHLAKPRWPHAFLAGGLMILCAGSELFYMAPVFLLLHAAHRPRRPLDSKDALVWGAYGAMMLLNGYLFLRIGRLGDLTLPGHFFHNAVMVPHPPRPLMSFLGQLNLLDLPPVVQAVLMGAGVAAAFLRRSPAALFGCAYLVLVVGMSWFMNFTYGANLVHLLTPSLIVMAVGATDLADRVLGRAVRDRRASDLWAGLLCAALLVPVMAPWRVKPVPEVPAPYRCVKAVGSAIRELGGSNMPDTRVFIASNHTMVPTTMEYYLGL